MVTYVSIGRYIITLRQSPVIGHFTVVCLVAKPLIWSEAEGDLVVIETSIQLA